MSLPHPIDQYTPLTEADLVHQLEMYTLLNNKWLPISRRGSIGSNAPKRSGHLQRRWRAI